MFWPAVWFWNWIAGGGPRRIVALLVMVGAIAVSSRIVFFPARGLKWQTVAPHYLAYFNELAGGPANGFKELVDSNLDWGQDLKNLKLWLDGA